MFFYLNFVNENLLQTPASLLETVLCWLQSLVVDLHPTRFLIHFLESDLVQYGMISVVRMSSGAGGLPSLWTLSTAPSDIFEC